MLSRYGLYRRCTRKFPIPNSTFLAPSHPITEPFTVPEIGPILEPIDGEGDGWVCQEFPTRSECAEFGEQFCVLWATAGYAAYLSLVPCLASLIGLLFIFLHRGMSYLSSDVDSWTKSMYAEGKDQVNGRREQKRGVSNGNWYLAQCSSIVYYKSSRSL